MFSDLMLLRPHNGMCVPVLLLLGKSRGGGGNEKRFTHEDSKSDIHIGLET